MGEPAKKKPRAKRMRPITLRRAATPIVAKIICAVNASPLSAADISALAGVNRHCIPMWANGGNPSVASVEAVLHALGYELVVVRKAISNV